MTIVNMHVFVIHAVRDLLTAARGSGRGIASQREGAQRVMAETYGAVYDVNGSILVQRDQNYSGCQKAYSAGPDSGRLLLTSWDGGACRRPSLLPRWRHTDEGHLSSLFGCYVTTMENDAFIPAGWVVRADKRSPLGRSWVRFQTTFQWRRALRSRTMRLLSRIKPLENFLEVQSRICYNVCGGSASWSPGR